MPAAELPDSQALAAASVFVAALLGRRNVLQPPLGEPELQQLLIETAVKLQEKYQAGILPGMLRLARAELKQQLAERRRTQRAWRRGYRQAQKARLRKVRRATAPRAACSFAARARGPHRRRRALVRRSRAGRSRKRHRASSEPPADGVGLPALPGAAS